MADKRRDFDLYFNGEIIQLEGGRKVLRRKKIEYDRTEPDIYHLVLKGQTISWIAWFYYRNFTNPLRAMRYWKYIADVNNITNPLDLSELVGQQIVIPEYNRIRLSE